MAHYIVLFSLLCVMYAPFGLFFMSIVHVFSPTANILAETLVFLLIVGALVWATWIPVMNNFHKSEEKNREYNRSAFGYNGLIQLFYISPLLWGLWVSDYLGLSEDEQGFWVIGSFIVGLPIATLIIFYYSKFIPESKGEEKAS